VIQPSAHPRQYLLPLRLIENFMVKILIAMALDKGAGRGSRKGPAALRMH
jgi:hypothetical protein